MSLAGQMFTEKEHLVTIDRFTWYRGIRIRDIIAKIMRNTITVSVKPFYNVSDLQERAVCCLNCSFATVKNM